MLFRSGGKVAFSVLLYGDECLLKTDLVMRNVLLPVAEWGLWGYVVVQQWIS